MITLHSTFSYAIILVEVATRMDPYSVSAHERAILVQPYSQPPPSFLVTGAVRCRSLVRH